MTRAEELANDHWEWLESILLANETKTLQIEAVELIYTSAFIHGWKHALEEQERDRFEKMEVKGE